MSRPRIGIALGSGSARGWAHIGVLGALREHGIAPEIAVGCSMGSLVAAAYASDQLDKLRGWATGLTRLDVVRLLDTTFRGGGLMTGNRLMREVRAQIDDRDIESLQVTFGAVATDLNTGQEIWLREGSMLGAVRASSGLPGLFIPVLRDSRWMIDGGVVNPVPVSLCRALGADYVIAVNLNTQFVSYPRVPQHADERTAAEASAGSGTFDTIYEGIESLVKMVRSSNRQEPDLLDVLTSSIHIMQNRITRSRMAGDPPEITITPTLGDFQLMDFHRAGDAIAAGIAAVELVSREVETLRRICQQAP